LINPIFWVTAIAVYLLLLLKLPGSLTFRFGLFNLITLNILLGWETALSAFGFAFLVWTALYLIIAIKNIPNKTSSDLLSLVFLFLLFFLYLLHKSNLANLAFSIKLKGLIPWFPAEVLLPFFVTLSFSYIFVRCIDLFRSCIWEKTPLVDPISLVGYLTPFHMLIAGPVNIYREHVNINNKNTDSIPPVSTIMIINEITTGLFYKFVLAEGIRIYFYGLNGSILVTEWFDSIILIIYIFFDFAGYSKIARGLGLLYGIPTPVNFNAPFLSTSITEFFTRWHMSMGQFILRNIFTPIQLVLVRRFGVSWSVPLSIVTMVISFGFVGLWHRLSWTWLLWGVVMGFLLAAEKHSQILLKNLKWQPSGYIKTGIDNLGRLYIWSMLTLTIYLISSEVFPE
jgi:D-alanyl-lipoteichoic acid acyltransferase DltB (MBOAT superfamily)